MNVEGGKREAKDKSKDSGFFYWVGEIVAITEIMKMGKEFDRENSELNIRYLMFACGTSNNLLDICILSSVQGTGRT